MKSIARDIAAVSVYSLLASITRLTVTATGARARAERMPAIITATSISISVKPRLLVITAGTVQQKKGAHCPSGCIALRNTLEMIFTRTEI